MESPATEASVLARVPLSPDNNGPTGTYNQHRDSEKGSYREEDVVSASDVVTNPKKEDEGPESFFDTMKSIFWNYAFLSVAAFGGPQAHIAMFHQRFVTKLRWMTDKQFSEILGIGSAIPGPTSTEFCSAIGAVRGGLPGALLALVTFQFPGFFIMLLSGLGMKNAYENNKGKAPTWLSEATVGLKPASISLIFVAGYKLGRKICGKNPLNLALALISTYFGIWMPAKYASWGYPVMLAGSGAITVLNARFVMKRRKENGAGEISASIQTPTSDTSAVEKQAEEEKPYTFHMKKRLAAFLFFLWAAIFVTNIILRNVADIEDPYFLLFEAFYRVGSLIFGGGQVALPMLTTEVVDTGWLPASVFYDGLALIQSLPGPMFNLSAYLGAAYLGVGGGIIAWVGIFAPGIMIMLAILPFWEVVRQYSIVQEALEGINSSAIGLICAAFVFMYSEVVHNLGEAAVLVLCGALVTLFAIPTPFAIIASGFVGWAMMRLDLGGPYCTVPTYIERNPETADYCNAANTYFKGQ